jgi:16S rRNA (cytosine967-C5)-methyltransferase
MGPRGRKGSAPTARSVAATVIERVLRDQAFASAALDAELDRAVQLEARDKRLATALVYGALRTWPELERMLGKHAPRGLDRVDRATRSHLLVAAYQLAILEKIPAFAAVSEAVDSVRAQRGEGMARFVNALLRKLAAEVDSGGRIPLSDAVSRSVQPWLMARLCAALGSKEQAASYVAAGPWPPPSCIRLRRGEAREAWVTRLTDAAPGARIEPGRISPLCITLQGAGELSRLPGHATHWSVQEEGSQVVGLALGAQPGERVLDACAGRGNKTTLLAEAVQGGEVDAADLYDTKLVTLQRQLEALGARAAKAYAVDWSVGTGEVPEGYDRVLIDAPCSGTGTIRRRPDLLMKDLKGALPGLQQLQRAILARAASRVRPGGTLVYAVCSVLREEAEDVVEHVLATCPWLQAAPMQEPMVRTVAREEASMRLLPHEHGTDGYFIASLRRSEAEGSA